MEERVLSIKNMLDIILKTTKKNANILADRYLLKDVSLISKWRNNKVVPKNDDISQIVDFAVNESTEVQRRLIRDKIELLIYNSSLKENIKETILNIEAFDEFLEEALNSSTAAYYKDGRLNSQAGKRPEKAEEDYSGEEDENADSTAPDSKKDIDGEYSGIVKFDLILTKKNRNRIKDILGGADEELESSVSFALKNRINTLQKYIVRGKTTLGIVIFAVITSGFFMIWAANSNQNPDPGADFRRGVYAGPAATSTPAPVQEPWPAVNKVPVDTPTPDKPTDTPVPTLRPAAHSGGHQSPSGNSNSAVDKSKSNNTETGDLNNSSINNVNINGDGNNVQLGNGNAMSFDKR